jgi:hypothetical protein
MHKNDISLRISFLAFCALLGLGGCAAKKVALEPEIPVFRYEQFVHNDGFRGNFAFENHEVITVTPDKKSTDSTFKWTGAVMGLLMSDTRKINIVRLDKDIVWDIDMKKKRYMEYPIRKTAMQLGVAVDDPNAETVYVEDCTKCKSSIRRSGIKKVVNSYDAEQVILSMKCKEQKEPGQSPVSTTVTLEVWIAPGVKFGSEMDEFSKAYARKAGMDMQVQISRAAGEEMLKAFPMVKELGLLMKDVKGYPILSILTIENDQYLKQANEERKKKAAEEKDSDISASPKAMITGFLGKKMKESQDAKEKEEDMKWGNVIWRVSWESRNFKKTNVTASTFNLPEDLKKEEQKEYVEGEQGKAITETKPAHYATSACLATLTEAQLGVPVFPGAAVERSQPYDASHHNTTWYFKRGDDYRVRYATSDSMDKVVAFYEGKLKTKCRINTREESGQAYKEAVCSQPLANGKVRTFRMDEKPIEMSIGSEDSQQTASASQTAKKVLPFELSVQNVKAAK